MPPGMAQRCGRFNRPCGEIKNSGLIGAIGLAVDLSAMPIPSGTLSVTAGETLHFQCWFRDQGAHSNFASGSRLTMF
jgi:hypothetical protein